MMTEQEEMDYEMRPEYDFSKARRNPYAARANAKSNLIAIDADLMEAFPTSEAVNEALRKVLQERKRDAA